MQVLLSKRNAFSSPLSICSVKRLPVCLILLIKYDSVTTMCRKTIHDYGAPQTLYVWCDHIHWIEWLFWFEFLNDFANILVQLSMLQLKYQEKFLVTNLDNPVSETNATQVFRLGSKQPYHGYVTMLPWRPSDGRWPN